MNPSIERPNGLTNNENKMNYLNIPQDQGEDPVEVPIAPQEEKQIELDEDAARGHATLG